MNKISVYIIAYNQITKIESAIKSVLWADEILVIDSYSTDGTTELAKIMCAGNSDTLSGIWRFAQSSGCSLSV